MGHRQQGDEEPLKPFSWCRDQVRGSNARGHIGLTRPRQGSTSPPEGVSLSLDVCAGTQLPRAAPTPPARFLFGDTREALRCPRNSGGQDSLCLQATVFENSSCAYNTLPAFTFTSEIRKH